MTDKLSFKEWLEKELIQRGWRPADLSRASKIDQAVLSNILNERKNPGVDTCRRIAKAFKMPDEEVFRAAGLLPPELDGNTAADNVTYLMLQMNKDDQLEILEYVKLKHKLATERTLEHEGNRKRVPRRNAPA